MTRVHLLVLITIMALTLTLPRAAFAQGGSLPHLFVGTANIDGRPARSGTMVFAFVDGKPAGSVAVGNNGKFTGLQVAGPGSQVTFKIGDLGATQRLSWNRGGATSVELTASRPRSVPIARHVFSGVATIGGVPAPDGTVVTAWAADAKIGSAVVREGRYLLRAARPAVAMPVTFTVGDLAADEEVFWEQGGATSLELTARSYVSLPEILLAPLGENLVRVFRFDNATKTWTFYDPRDEFAEANTIVGLFSYEVYLIKVAETATVVLNGRSRTVTCVRGNCWNEIVW
jgi:hypothetical protein